MITSDTYNSILQTIVSLVIVPAVIVLGNAAFNFIKTKTANAKLDKYLDMANDAVTTAVAQTMQTFVSTLKSKGEWTEDSAKEALSMAKLKAQEIMGAAALKALPEIVGDVDAWIESKVEAATLAAKSGCSV